MPTLDGTNLSNVTATKIGETTAEQVKAGLATITNATDAGTAATVVKRDAAGNFVANTVTATLVGFATGKKGADLTVSGSTLTVGPDGNFFDVIAGGGATEITAIAPTAAGTQVTVRFRTTLWLRQSASLSLTGNGDFKAIDGDIFEFVSTGAGNWIERARTVTNDSSVFATNLAGGNVPTNAAPSYPPFGTVGQDTQSEFDTASATFTPRQSGLYDVSASYLTDGISWTAGDICQLAFVLTGAPKDGYSNARTMMPTVAGASCQVSQAGVLELPRGATLRIGMNIYGSASVPASVPLYTGPGAGTLTFLRIRRVRN